MGRIAAQSQLSATSEVPANSSSSPTNSEQHISSSEYVHNSSITSPFYYYVISPVCDKLIEYEVVPRWVTPNQLSLLGLACSIFAVIFAKLKIYSWVWPFWVVYGFLDNLDGKQARFTKASSRGGDFLDHAVDSIASSLGVLLCLLLLAPVGMDSWVFVWMLTAGQMPFYLGTWAHFVLGRTLLGSQVYGRDVFTVDEANFLCVPFLTSLRIFSPNFLDYPIYTHKWMQFWFGSTSGTLTLGMLAVWMIIGFLFVSSLRVVRIVYKPHVLHLLVPGLAYGFVSLLLHPPVLLMISSFSLITFMLLGIRLKKPGSGIAKVWNPVWPYTVIAIGCRYFSVDVTWGLSNPITASLALVYCCSTSVLLIRYTNQLNQIS